MIIRDYICHHVVVSTLKEILASIGLLSFSWASVCGLEILPIIQLEVALSPVEEFLLLLGGLFLSLFSVLAFVFAVAIWVGHVAKGSPVRI